MRLLHTGDWHVGKTLRGRSRATEHRDVLREIVGLAAAREVDVVLVAGDLFDSASPSPEAEQIVYRALVDLARTGATVVVIAGNHDNPRRLAAVEPLLGLTGIIVRPEPARPEQGGVLTLETRGGERARIALLPFLSQRSIVRADHLMLGEAADHASRYAERAVRVIEALTTNDDDATVNIAMAHLMVHGAMLGGGERSAHTIHEYSVPTHAFPAHLHYVALGHLHRAQRLEAGCPVWYCGSPLQLDFGETAESKSVNLVEARAGKPATVDTVPLTAGRRLRRVRATLDGLEGLKDEVGDDYLRVELEAAPQPGLSARVRELLPQAIDVQIVGKSRVADEPRRGPAPTSLAPHEAFAAYLSVQGIEDTAVLALFKELLEEEHAPTPA